MQNKSQPAISDMPSPGHYRRLRKRIYDLVQSNEHISRAALWVHHAISALIILNIITVMIETMKDAYDQYQTVLHWIDIVSVAIFTVEYLVRLWVVVEDPRYSRPIRGRLRYAFSFFAMIDLLAILPFYLPMFFKFDLRTLRVLRLFRLIRLLKLGRYSRAATAIVGVFRERREELLMSVGTILLLLVLSSSVIYYLEHEAQPESFPNIPASLWWGVVTLTTVGYGDVYPITMGGKIFAAFISILSIGLVALPSGIIVSGFIREDEEKIEEELEEQKEEIKQLLSEDRKQESEHGIVCPHCGTHIDMHTHLTKT